VLSRQKAIREQPLTPICYCAEALTCAAVMPKGVVSTVNVSSPTLILGVAAVENCHLR
jgi:hypothetical protein